MGYRVVDADSVEPEADRPCECRKLGDAAGLSAMAVNRFRAAPGEKLPLAYHYHETQEEAFYVLSGSLAVETPEGTHEAPTGHLFAVDPESPQLAYNPPDADEPVEVLAIGAPPVQDDAVPYDPGAGSQDTDPAEDPGDDRNDG